MLLIDYIKDNFTENTPFSPSEIKIKQMSDDAIKMELSRLYKKGALKKVSRGLYYIPGSDKSLPSSIDLIEKSYIGSGDNVFGFYMGPLYIKSILGQRPLESDHICIMSNKMSSGKRDIYRFKKKISLRKPYFTIEKSNVEINGFLTYLATASYEDIQTNFPILSNYIRANHLSANDVIKLTPYFPSKMTSKLLSSDLYRSLWKH